MAANLEFLDLRKIKAISDFQFGNKITDILFKDEKDIKIEKSKNTGKIRYIYLKDQLLLTLRPNNGLFTLTLYAAKIIINNIKKPILRIVVQNDIAEFIAEGRNVFCKHVVDIDENLRPNDEVIIVNENDKLLAVGRLKIPVSYIKSFKSGVAVNVRRGIKSLKN